MKIFFTCKNASLHQCVYTVFSASLFDIGEVLLFTRSVCERDQLYVYCFGGRSVLSPFPTIGSRVLMRVDLAMLP